MATIRKKDGKDYITDNGNLIADCQFNEIVNPEQIDAQLYEIPGSFETGLFLKRIVDVVVVGHANQTTIILK